MTRRIVQVVSYRPCDDFLIVLADDNEIWQLEWVPGGDRKWVKKAIPPLPND